MYPRHDTDDLPEILISRPDHDLLDQLLGDSDRQGAAGLLRREIDRATVLEAAELPRDAVALYRWTHYVDEAGGPPRRVRLVLPTEADIDRGQVSVLSHVGAGLLGLREGMSIRWPDPAGRVRRLTPILVEDAEVVAG